MQQLWGRLLTWQLPWQSLTPSSLLRVSHRRSFLQRLAVCRVLYGSILLECWWEQRPRSNRCSSNKDNQSFESIVKESRLKNLGELQKEWTKAWGATTNVGPQERCYCTTVRFLISSQAWVTNTVRSIYLGKGTRTGLLLSGSKSFIHIKLNFIFHLEIGNGKLHWKWMSKSMDQAWRGIDSKVFKVQCEGSGASDVLGFWFWWWLVQSYPATGRF